jgi:hypothetical protein
LLSALEFNTAVFLVFSIFCFLAGGDVCIISDKEQEYPTFDMVALTSAGANMKRESTAGQRPCADDALTGPPVDKTKLALTGVNPIDEVEPALIGVNVGPGTRSGSGVRSRRTNVPGSGTGFSYGVFHSFPGPESLPGLSVDNERSLFGTFLTELAGTGIALAFLAWAKKLSSAAAIAASV